MSNNMQDLTASDVQRQSVLNNKFAIERIQSELSLGGIMYEGMPVFTKPQVAQILGVDERTVDRYINTHNDELTRNGYVILRSSDLNKFKELVNVGDMGVVEIDPRVPQLGIFKFRAVLNLAMLVTESESARAIRSRILDIVIDVITNRAGGDTKYINQRDVDFLDAAYQEENYRKDFTSALSRYVEGNQWKYKHCTDAVYQAIFQERATEYRKILKLEAHDNVRDTFYSELLELIASFEAGLPEALEQASKASGGKLSVKEAMDVIAAYGQQKAYKPLIDGVRTKMATRDLNFREALHTKLENYIKAMPENDYEKFLGEKSKALEVRIQETLDVYKRLKDR